MIVPSRESGRVQCSGLSDQGGDVTGSSTQPLSSESSTEHRKRVRADSAVVIPTRNRPDELLSAIEALLLQSVLPGEICVVDSSDETRSRREIEILCREAEVPLDYFHPAPRGLTIQRNIGVDRTRGDPIFFIDDDVLLAPDCHEQILKGFARNGAEVGGISATPSRSPRRSLATSQLFQRVFGLGGCDRDNFARMRPGFWCEQVCNPSDVVRLECMRGLCMSFRRAVFEHERFDDILPGYGLKEDVDFGYRVSRHYLLLQIPTARCDHIESPRNRLNSHLVMRVYPGNHVYLHRKNMPQDLRHQTALWWGLFGLLLWFTARAIIERDAGLVTGFLAGAWDQLRGRGLLDPETRTFVKPEAGMPPS
jgi:glycosyltransferase involved in cell wall biosynthesis